MTLNSNNNTYNSKSTTRKTNINTNTHRNTNPNTNDDENENSLDSSMEILFKDLIDNDGARDEIELQESHVHAYDKNKNKNNINNRINNGNIDRQDSEELYVVEGGGNGTESTHGTNGKNRQGEQGRIGSGESGMEGDNTNTTRTNSGRRYGGLGVVQLDILNYHEWSQKHVILWIKNILKKSELSNDVIVLFLREFAKQCVDGKMLVEFRNGEKSLDSFSRRFRVENRNHVIWKQVKSAIDTLSQPTAK